MLVCVRVCVCVCVCVRACVRACMCACMRASERACYLSPVVELQYLKDIEYDEKVYHYHCTIFYVYNITNKVAVTSSNFV